MSRLVSGLLILVGAYVAVFYGLWPTDPCISSCPGRLIASSLPFSPDPTIVGIISIVVGALALLVGVFGLVRGAGTEASVALAAAGVYLLLLRFLFPSSSAAAANTSYPPQLLLAWVSLIGGALAIIAGIVFLVRGQSAEA